MLFSLCSSKSTPVRSQTLSTDKMKLSTILLSLVLLGLGTASPASHSAQQACGKLGIMTVDVSKLPLDVDPNNIRQCADHPAGKASAARRRAAAQNHDNDAASARMLFERTCWYGKSSGCSGGYCFKSCGASGEWCWTAYNGGYGAWITCSSDSACSTDQACGLGDNCSSCGCSC